MLDIPFDKFFRTLQLNINLLFLALVFAASHLAGKLVRSRSLEKSNQKLAGILLVFLILFIIVNRTSLPDSQKIFDLWFDFQVIAINLSINIALIIHPSEMREDVMWSYIDRFKVDYQKSYFRHSMKAIWRDLVTAYIYYLRCRITDLWQLVKT